MKKRVMAKAWQLARMGAARFGGSVRLYFACALRLAWQEIRNPRPVTVWQPHLGAARFVLPGVNAPRIQVMDGEQFYLQIIGH